MRSFSLRVFFLIFLSSIASYTYGTSLKPIKPNHFIKVLGTSSYVLSRFAATALVQNCGIKGTDKLSQFWNPTVKQIRIIDRKANIEINKIDQSFSEKNTIKLHIGLTDSLESTHIFVFVFPKSFFQTLKAGFENDINVCTKLKAIVDFDLNTLETSFSEPDITNALKRRQEKRLID